MIFCVRWLENWNDPVFEKLDVLNQLLIMNYLKKWIQNVHFLMAAIHLHAA